MSANLDLNSYRITNLPTAINDSEPVTLGQAASIAGVTNPLTQAAVAAVLWPQSSAEITAGVTPTNYEYEPGNVLRYGTNTTPGTTDMTTAVQAAFDSVGDGQHVIIPPGTYLLSSNITMTSKDNISIIGYGAILKEASGVLTAMLAFTTCDFLRVEGIDFVAGEDDTYFQANDPTGSGREFISLATCNDVFIRSISGKDKRNFITAVNCNRIAISDFSFYGFAGTKASPNTSSNANYLWCINLTNCDYSSVSDGRCTEHGSTVLSQEHSDGVTLTNLNSRDVHDNGIYVSSGTNIAVTGCTMKNSNGDGIQVRGENITVTGNVLNSCGDFGIAATPTSTTDGSCVITDNHIDTCQRGIRTLSNTNQPVDVVISNNVVQNCTESANNGAIEANSTTGRASICGNIIRTSTLDNGIFIPDNGAPFTHIVICSNLISDLNGNATSNRGGIRVDDGAEMNISNNVFNDIASGIGVRLTSCDGGVVSGNIYEGGQVVRVPTAETNTNIFISGNRGSTLVADGDNCVIGQNDATVTGYPASSTTPQVIGQITIDTGEAYISTGTASSADWQQITP